MAESTPRACPACKLHQPPCRGVLDQRHRRHQGRTWPALTHCITVNCSLVSLARRARVAPSLISWPRTRMRINCPDIPRPHRSERARGSTTLEESPQMPRDTVYKNCGLTMHCYATPDSPDLLFSALICGGPTAFGTLTLSVELPPRWPLKMRRPMLYHPMRRMV